MLRWRMMFRLFFAGTFLISFGLCQISEGQAIGIISAKLAQNSQVSPPRSIDFPALEDNFTRIPPDVSGAVGPNHLVIALNSQIRVQDKNGNVLRTYSSLESFWQPLIQLNPGALVDPRILYDSSQDRWILISIDQNEGAFFLLAISKSGDPTGDYWRYKFQVDIPGSLLKGDYPNIGFSDTLLAITMNIFSPPGETPPGDTFRLSRVFAFKKLPLYSGTNQSPTVFNDKDHFSLVPVQPASSSPTLYLISEEFPIIDLSSETANHLLIFILIVSTQGLNFIT